MRTTYGFLYFWVVFVSGNDFYMLEDSQSPKHLIEGIGRYLGANNTNISEKCFQNLQEYAAALQAGEFWALNMYDSSSRVPIMTIAGQPGDLGEFDRCLKIETYNSHGRIFGKYCLGLQISSLGLGRGLALQSTSDFGGQSVGEFEMPTQNANLNPAMLLISAACSPSDCSVGEIQEYHMESGVNLFLSEDLCQEESNRPRLDSGAIATIAVLAIVLGIMLLSTVYDVFLHYKQKNPAHDSLTAFSILTNGKNLLKSNNNHNQLSCLHGIRVISMMIVINGHKYTTFKGVPTVNGLDYHEWHSFTITAGGKYLVVDTFLLLSGLLLAYAHLNRTAEGSKFHIVKFYMNRYLRLTPVLGIIMLISITLLKYLVTSPLWPRVTHLLSQPCKDNWWAVLLYAQNYGYASRSMCILPSWYLCVDMQLYFLSPLILIALKKKPKYALTAIGLLALCTAVTALLTVWFYKLRLHLAGDVLQDILDFDKYYYYPTHTRATPWFVGIALGYLLHTTKEKGGELMIERKLRTTVLGLWILSLLVMAACFFGKYNIGTGEYKRLESAIYFGIAPLAWALAVSWMIFACVHGYGGPVNWFLSLPFFQFLSKLSYSMYLVNFLELPIVNYGVATFNIRFSHAYMFYSYCGDLVFTFLGAIVMVLAFEYPVANILMIMGSNKTKTTKVNDNQKDDGKSIKTKL